MVAVKEIAETAQAQVNTVYRVGQSAMLSGIRSVRDNLDPATDAVRNSPVVDNPFVDRVVDYIAPVIEPIADTATSAIESLPTPQEITATTFDLAEKALAGQRELAERIAEIINPESAPAPATKTATKKATTKKATAKKASPKKAAPKKTAAKASAKKKPATKKAATKKAVKKA